MKLSLATIVACLLSGAAFGANIAVIDSGVDYKHMDLKHNIWENPASPQDVVADGKTYKNAINGWNFAESNNQIIDYKYLGTFSADCTKIFETQAKILQGTATQAEKDWYAQKKADQTFLKELGKFGNFVHGTHVSGISARNAVDAKIIGMKLIPTEQSVRELIAHYRAHHGNRAADNPMAKMYLQMMAQRQGDMLATTGKFAAATLARVANGSFGTSVAAVKPVMKQLLTQILGSEPSEADQVEYAKFFINEVIKSCKAFVAAAPKTLFVFAAGNDGADNDTMPVSPANVKADNVITVAATNGTASLATFSNYGATLVEVAAPGVAIDSTIPGDKHLQMSGTSMAAPFVTNVAGLVVDENNALSPLEVKKVLMSTVDVKAFLQGKVVTSGIVNKARAVEAARLSRSMPLTAAIAQAKRDILDADMPALRGEQDLIVLPLSM